MGNEKSDEKAAQRAPPGERVRQIVSAGEPEKQLSRT
jgi:hypothetical protein